MPLIKYTASNVKGLKTDSKELEIFIDIDFEPYADIMNEEAKRLRLLAIVISAKRDTINVEGAIVEPAKMSNHLIGMGVDVNIIDLDTKEYWNSKKLNAPIGKAREFIRSVTEKGIRWGGNFKKADTVHFDSGLNVRDPELYKLKYAEYFPIAA